MNWPVNDPILLQVKTVIVNKAKLLEKKDKASSNAIHCFILVLLTVVEFSLRRLISQLY